VSTKASPWWLWVHWDSRHATNGIVWQHERAAMGYPVEKFYIAFSLNDLGQRLVPAKNGPGWENWGAPNPPNGADPQTLPVPGLRATR
jgi:hypothetical protein